MSTTWLTEDEQRAWVRFATVLELLPGVLDSQLVRDEGLTHFDYFTLAMLSDAPDRTLRMTTLARWTSATLPRLSRVTSRLEGQGFLRRLPCPDDGRVTNVVLTEEGMSKLEHAAPGHVQNVRKNVIDALGPQGMDDLSSICGLLLRQLDPEGKLLVGALR